MALSGKMVNLGLGVFLSNSPSFVDPSGIFKWTLCVHCGPWSWIIRFDLVRGYSRGCPPPMMWGMMFISYGVLPLMIAATLWWLGEPVAWRFAAVSILPELIGLVIVGACLWRLDAEWVNYWWPKKAQDEARRIQ